MRTFCLRKTGVIFKFVSFCWGEKPKKMDRYKSRASAQVLASFYADEDEPFEYLPAPT